MANEPVPGDGTGVTRREARALRVRVAAVAVAALLPMLVALGLLYEDETRWQHEMSERWLDEQTERIADRFESGFADASAIVRAFAQTDEALEAGPACDALAAELVRRSSRLTNIAVTDAQGNGICSGVPLAAPASAADRLFFQRALASEDVAVGDLVIGRVTGLPAVHVAYAVRRDGEVQRVVFAALGLDLLQPGSVPQMPPDGALLLLDDDGRVLWRSPEPARWVGTTLEDPRLRAFALDDGAGVLEADGLDGVPRHHAASAVGLGAQRGHLLVALPSSAITERAWSNLARNVAFVLLVAGLGIGAALWAGDRWIVHRAGVLASTMRRLGEGDLGARASDGAGSAGALERELDRMAAALDELTRENRLLLRSVGFAVLGTDAEGRIVFANPRAERLIGRALDELRGSTLHDALHGPRAVHDADACPLHAPLSGRSVTELDHEVETADGPVPVSFAATPMEDERGVHGVGLVVEDLRGRRSRDEAEERVRKLEVVARLAGGVAHDFNNLLAIMLGYAETVRDRVAPGSADRADLDQVLIAGERASALTRRLLAFSRHEAGQPRLLRIDDAVRDAARVIGRLVGSGIEVSVTTGAPSCGVSADPQRVEQILLNLALNARDAMPEGGRLEIRTGVSERRPGRALLVVSDTGAGIPPEVRASLFEPFVTTKPRGTGLGLAIVKEYVEALGGTVRVESGREGGTRFEIELPCVEMEPEEPAAPAVRAAATVLVVEDEPALLNVEVQVLRSEGYTVLAAKDAASAVAALEAHPEIRLVVCDVVLPDGRGPKLLERFRAERPDLRVVFTSGYADAPSDGAPLLTKPFRPSALVQVVREALAHP